MSNDLDLIRTSETAELLDRLAVELPGLKGDKYATDIVASMLWLDQARGDSRPDDYILVNRDLGEVLMYEADIADAAVGYLWGKACVYGIAHDTDTFLRKARNPFMVEFPLRDDIPVNIRGKKVAVAIMSLEESDQEPFVDYEAITMRHDHTIVGDNRPFRRAA